MDENSRDGAPDPRNGAPDPRDGAHAKTCTAQRIRVGLTGLAAILLMVMGAAAGMRPARSVAPVDGQGETLAVLGVAPSSGIAATLYKNGGQAQPAGEAAVAGPAQPVGEAAVVVPARSPVQSRPRTAVAN